MMEWVVEHILGLIIIILLSYNIYQKHILLREISKLFEKKVEEPVKADLKLQRHVEKKMDDALAIKPIIK